MSTTAIIILIVFVGVPLLASFMRIGAAIFFSVLTLFGGWLLYAIGRGALEAIGDGQIGAALMMVGMTGGSIALLVISSKRGWQS
jgi:ABC-type amino acid transport system permease subunit